MLSVLELRNSEHRSAFTVLILFITQRNYAGSTGASVSCQLSIKPLAVSRLTGASTVIVIEPHYHVDYLSSVRRRLNCITELWIPNFGSPAQFDCYWQRFPVRLSVRLFVRLSLKLLQLFLVAGSRLVAFSETNDESSIY